MPDQVQTQPQTIQLPAIPALVNPYSWVIELAKAGGLSAIAAVVLWQLTTAFISQSQQLTVTFTNEMKTERDSHKDAITRSIESNAAQLRLVQESCDRRTDRMVESVRTAVEEMKRVSEKIDTGIKALERSGRGESRISPVKPDGESGGPGFMIRYVSPFFARAIVSATVPFTFNAPPALTIPAEVRPIGEYATLKPDTDAVSITYVGLDGVDGFPSDFLKDPRHFILPVRGLKEGRYKFAAVAAWKDGVQARADFTVIVGVAPQPPPVVVPPVTPPTPPVTPPPVTNPPPTVPPVDQQGSLFFVVIRPNGAITSDLEKVLSDVEWENHRKAGRPSKVYTYDEIGDRYKLPAGTRLPTVVTLRIAADGKTSKVVREAIDLPTTSDGIRKLTEGITK